MIQQRLSNEELLSTLSATWCEEGVLVARTIVMLMEVEDRRLHLELACSSMFDLCTRRLGMSEGEAFRRITAARLAKRFPPVLDAMRKQYVHRSSLVLLRELFTRENVDELLAAAAGKTKRAVQELVAKLAPRPDVPASIRKLPPARAIPTATTTPTTTPTATTTPTTTATTSATTTTTTNATPITTATATGLPWPLPDALPIAEARVVATPTSTPSAPPRDIAGQLVPLAEARHKVQFTASSTRREKLERAPAARTGPPRMQTAGPPSRWQLAASPSRVTPPPRDARRRCARSPITEVLQRKRFHRFCTTPRGESGRLPSLAHGRAKVEMTPAGPVQDGRRWRRGPCQAQKIRLLRNVGVGAERDTARAVPRRCPRWRLGHARLPAARPVN
ncbi:MAG: hypothetical protein U0270_43940 [Labilithrix sp.]